MGLDEVKICEIFFADLTPCAQQRFAQEIGSTIEDELKFKSPIAIVMRDLSNEEYPEEPSEI